VASLVVRRVGSSREGRGALRIPEHELSARLDGKHLRRRRGGNLDVSTVGTHRRDPSLFAAKIVTVR
jgi:hypothetical protein